MELDVESVVNREISRRLSLDTVVSQLGFQIAKASAANFHPFREKFGSWGFI